MGEIDSFSIRHEYFSICFHNNTETRANRNSRKGKWHHYGLFHRVANMLCNECRFEPSDTPYPELTVCNYPSLWPDRRWGGNQYLRFEGHRYPAGFEFEFWYQDSRTGREDNIGFYDSDKMKNATTVERLVFKRASDKVANFMTSLGFENKTEVEARGLLGVMQRIKSLREFQGPSYDYERYRHESYHINHNARDRDKKLIENEQVKYYRDYRSGRLMRGIVYHNINNMWWVVLNKDRFTNIACFELFDATPEDFAVRRKKRDGAKPHEKVRRKIGTKQYNELVALGVEMKLKEERE
jgi:hypothetical protein